MQFGPVVVCKEYLLLLAVVTDRQGTVRAVDGLVDGDGPPHLTLGCQPPGGGWVREIHSGLVRWDVAGAPSSRPDCSTLEWSQEIEHQMDMSELVEKLSEDVGLFGAAARAPVAASVFFYEDERFVLVGGEALLLYRRVQAAVERDLRTSICLARVPSSSPFRICFSMWFSGPWTLGFVFWFSMYNGTCSGWGIRCAIYRCFGGSSRAGAMVGLRGPSPTTSKTFAPTSRLGTLGLRRPRHRRWRRRRPCGCLRSCRGAVDVARPTPDRGWSSSSRNRIFGAWLDRAFARTRRPSSASVAGVRTCRRVDAGAPLTVLRSASRSRVSRCLGD